MSKTIDDLRETLFSALEAVKNGSMQLETARAINELAKTVIDTAKVEVDFLRVTDGSESTFIASAIGSANLPPGLPNGTAPATPGNGITGLVRHRLRG